MAAFLVHARLALPTSKLLGRCRAQAQPLVHQVLFQTANGLAEIRAFEAQAEMRRRFADVQRRALVSSEANQLWTFVVLLGGCQFISWVYAVAAIGVMVACSRASCFEESGMGTSAPGFILIGVRSLGDFSKTLVAQFVPVENAAIALERALEFTHGLPQEAPHSRAADAALPPGWPAGAALVFTNLSLRYAPELSDADLADYAFRYEVQINNARDAPVGVLGRRWEMIDGRGGPHEEEGEGIDPDLLAAATALLAGEGNDDDDEDDDMDDGRGYQDLYIRAISNEPPYYAVFRNGKQIPTRPRHENVYDAIAVFLFFVLPFDGKKSSFCTVERCSKWIVQSTSKYVPQGGMISFQK